MEPPQRELPVDIQTHSPYANQQGRGAGFYLKWLVVFILFLLSILIGMIVSQSTSQLPDIKILENYHPNESTQIFDRDGNLIANIHGDEDRVVVPLKSISPFMQRAVMAIEDNRFYEHNGIDFRGTIRAFAANISADDSVQGGSTVTQQLVKNLFLTPEKSYTRKLAEAILAMRVEKHYSKDKILEMYLNQVYFGNHSYGIEKAARRYFKKSARRLTLAESALLAGLLKAPEGLSPYQYPKAARKRQLEVLAKMVEYGYITPRQARAAKAQEITLNSRESKPSKHPYFIGYVIQELESLYGDDVVRRGGLRVYTTMDDAAQTAAEKSIEEGIKLAGKSSGVQQGALVSMDVQSGNILALVGGVNFEKNQFNSATMARRAVGSTFKPFVYLTGFRLEKFFPKSKISDHPVRYGNWAPHNWDGRYMGGMDIRRALTLSRNTTTVQVGMKVGIEEVIRTAQAAGITSTIDDNSSSLLGSSGVSPLELVTAYSTLARGGIYIRPTSIKRIEDSRGRAVKLDTPEPKRVFDQDYVAAVIDILIDAVEKGTGKNAILPDRVVAGKTGTTDEVRDIWFMGFTPDLVAGVWMGNSRNIPLKGVFSSNSAKAWHDYAEAYYQAHPTPPQQFFTASNDYAARAGLVHLIDPEGVADAKKRLSVEKFGQLPPAERPRTRASQNTGLPSPPTATTTGNSTTPTQPVTNRIAPQLETPTPPSPATKPSTASGNKPTWDSSLDNLNKNTSP